MSNKKKEKDFSQLADTIINSIQEKKGKEIVSLDLRHLSGSVCDFFIICNADSTTQCRAIANFVEEEVFKKNGDEVWHKEGFENAEWIILDFVNVVVHVFRTEKREFYGVEDLWGDAEVQQYQSA